jgi:hypothetical protein
MLITTDNSPFPPVTPHNSERKTQKDEPFNTT